MSAQTLEQRVSELEKKVAHLQSENAEETQPAPWWEKHIGLFQDSPFHEEAVRLGAEYRAAQPNPVDDFDAIELDWKK